MIIGITKKETEEFVSTQDTGEVKTIFVLKPISKESLMNMSVGVHTSVEKFADMAFKALKKTLVEIKNYSLNGAPVDLKANQINDEILNTIPSDVMMEIVSHLMSSGKMKEEEQKN